ncbi:uncharacterized protein KNAG_0B04730 [Huiozyma naganishii CBS 8797]|uniref:Uncharacterized protein n=1 Tax=Huiozyma naganishii (strain ATCC MYA-139 / BCRC 22969 / CBS 8797 / KCTC 17520 / NBRC 10181 / NCYC 3082 / Yp74L-3) TaxID=1071383 RepID=J7RH94_HUIN7|nr:hypothetical protein KNAG_0B04730 [Kazachstania naganishii CBS 8797]CCK68908.1 hypothetical protein KNAG_0B04730 [Kazachstania naganishii CBS 8797]
MTAPMPASFSTQRTAAHPRPVGRPPNNSQFVASRQQHQFQTMATNRRASGNTTTAKNSFVPQFKSMNNVGNDSTSGAKLPDTRSYTPQLKEDRAFSANPYGGNSMGHGHEPFVRSDQGTTPGRKIDNSKNSTEYLYSLEELPSFDLMTSSYTQEQVILKEMEFLEEKFLHLREYKRKYMDHKNDTIEEQKQSREGTDKNSINAAGRDPPDMRDESYLKRLKLNSAKLYNAVNGNQQQEPASDFPLLKPRSSDIVSSTGFHIEDTPNQLFSRQFLIIRDGFLMKFYRDLNDIVKSRFGESLREVKREKMSQRVEFSADLTHLKLVKPETTKQSLEYLFTRLPELPNIIPSLDQSLDRLMAMVDDIFTPENLSKTDFSTGQLSGRQLYSVGILSLFMLIFHASVVCDGGNGSEIAGAVFTVVDAHINQLKATVFIVAQDFNTQCASRDVEKLHLKLQFCSILKYYLGHIAASDERLNALFRIDCDEDIYLYTENSIDRLVTGDEKLIQLWNFVVKNYIYKKLFRGEIPELVSKEAFKRMIIKDSSLLRDSPLVDTELKLIDYLHTNEIEDDSLHSATAPGSDPYSKITIKQTLRLLDQLQKHYEATQTGQSEDGLKGSTLVTTAINSQIYFKIVLLTKFYILLQYERDGNFSAFQDSFLSYVVLIKTIILSQLDHLNLNNDNSDLAGYEFLLRGRSLSLISDCLEIMFSVYERMNNIHAVLNKPSSGTSLTTQESEAQGRELLLAALRHNMEMMRDTFTQLATCLAKFQRVSTASAPYVRPLVQLKTFIAYMKQTSTYSTPSTADANGQTPPPPQAMNMGQYPFNTQQINNALAGIQVNQLQVLSQHTRRLYLDLQKFTTGEQLPDSFFANADTFSVSRDSLLQICETMLMW